MGQFSCRSDAETKLSPCILLGVQSEVAIDGNSGFKPESVTSEKSSLRPECTAIVERLLLKCSILAIIAAHNFGLKIQYLRNVYGTNKPPKTLF